MCKVFLVRPAAGVKSPIHPRPPHLVAQVRRYATNPAPNPASMCRHPGFAAGEDRDPSRDQKSHGDFPEKACFPKENWLGLRRATGVVLLSERSPRTCLNDGQLHFFTVFESDRVRSGVILFRICQAGAAPVPFGWPGRPSRMRRRQGVTALLRPRDAEPGKPEQMPVENPVWPARPLSGEGLDIR